MVSQAQAPAPSRDRLLAAAAAEFAARGFDGAKVDRIAARARINKAMLYYHFTSKAALYRAILRDVFGVVAAAVDAVRARGGPPDAQIRGFIDAVAHTAVARPHFPSIWLREIAEGGRHVDAPVMAEIAHVMQTLAVILADGRRAGVFRDVDPFLTQVGIVGPLLFYAATAPVRERYREHAPYPIAAASRDAIVAHVETMTLAALAVTRPPDAPRRRPSRRHRV